MRLGSVGQHPDYLRRPEIKQEGCLPDRFGAVAVNQGEKLLVRTRPRERGGIGEEFSDQPVSRTVAQVAGRDPREDDGLRRSFDETFQQLLVPGVGHHDPMHRVGGGGKRFVGHKRGAGANVDGPFHGARREGRDMTARLFRRCQARARSLPTTH